MLSAEPELTVSSADGVDHILVESRGVDASVFPIFHPRQPAAHGCEPHAVPRVDEQRIAAVRRQALGPGIGNKRAVAETLQSVGAPDPQITFPILEERRHRFRVALLQAGDALRVKPQQPARIRAHPSVSIAVAHDSQRLKTIERGWKTGPCELFAVPLYDAIVGAYPQILIFAREQTIDFQIRQAVPD